MTRFLHITDLHVSSPDAQDPGRQTDTVATLARLIETANRIKPRPDFVVASGDLTNMGDPASYALLSEMMAELEMPVVYALGNHDRRAGFHEVFPGYPGAPDGPLDYDVVHAGLHVVVADTAVPGKVSGALDAAQFERLEAALESHPELPKILVLHHPVRVHGREGGWTTISAEDSARIGDLIAGRNVAAILSGHVHSNRVAFWRGAMLVVTMGQQSTVDLTRTDGLHIVEGAGFAICDLGPEGLHVAFAPLTQSRSIKVIPAKTLRRFA